MPQAAVSINKIIKHLSVLFLLQKSTSLPCLQAHMHLRMDRKCQKFPVNFCIIFNHDMHDSVILGLKTN